MVFVCASTQHNKSYTVYSQMTISRERVNTQVKKGLTECFDEIE